MSVMGVVPTMDFGEDSDVSQDGEGLLLPAEIRDKVREFFRYAQKDENGKVDIRELADRWSQVERTKGRAKEKVQGAFKRKAGSCIVWTDGKGLIREDGVEQAAYPADASQIGDGEIPGKSYLVKEEAVTFEIHEEDGKPIAAFIKPASGPLLTWQKDSIDKQNAANPKGVVSSWDRGCGQVRYTGYDGRVYFVNIYMSDRDRPVTNTPRERHAPLKKDDKIAFVIEPAKEDQPEASFVAAKWSVTDEDIPEIGEVSTTAIAADLDAQSSLLFLEYGGKNCIDGKITAPQFIKFMSQLYKREYEKAKDTRQKMLDKSHDHLKGLKDGTITPRKQLGQKRASLRRSSTNNKVPPQAINSKSSFISQDCESNAESENDELSPQDQALHDIYKEIRAFTKCDKGSEESCKTVPEKLVEDLVVARLRGDLMDLMALNPSSPKIAGGSPSNGGRLEGIQETLPTSSGNLLGSPQNAERKQSSFNHIPELVHAENALRTVLTTITEEGSESKCEQLKTVTETALARCLSGALLPESLQELQETVKKDKSYKDICQKAIEAVSEAIDLVNAKQAENLPARLKATIDELFDGRLDPKGTKGANRDESQKFCRRMWGKQKSDKIFTTFAKDARVIPKSFFYQQFNSELETMVDDGKDPDEAEIEIDAKIKVDAKIREWFSFMDENKSGTIEKDEESKFWMLFFANNKPAEEEKEAAASPTSTSGVDNNSAKKLETQGSIKRTKDRDHLTLDELYETFEYEQQAKGSAVVLDKLNRMMEVARILKRKARGSLMDELDANFGLPRNIKDLVDKWFDTLDMDHNGRIDLEELEQFFLAFGMEIEEAMSTARSYGEEVAFGGEIDQKLGIPVEAFYSQTKKDMEEDGEEQIIEALKSMIVIVEKMAAQRGTEQEKKG